MKRVSRQSIVGMMVLAVVPLGALAADYDVDSSHTNARFAIDHFGASTNHGGFYNLSGRLSFDAQAQTGFIDLAIPVSSVNSGNRKFDSHLKSADIFNAAEYPEMRFVSSKWHFQNGKVSSVEGNLSLLGKTRPVVLKAEKFNCYQSPVLRKEVCGGDFTATIDRTQWGMNYLVSMGMSKMVTLQIQVEAAKR